MRPILHPACAVFPPMPEDELKNFADDIAANGLLEAITMLDDQILDGRCRWDACEMVGVEPRTVPYEGDDPIGFVLSKNKHRRHLSKSQLAMIVAELASLPRGRQSTKGCDMQPMVNVLKKNIYSAKQRSEQADIPISYTRYARSVLADGEPHIAQMVRDGAVNVRVAGEVVRRLSRQEQAGLTAEDVEREGCKIVRAYPCNQRDTSKKPEGKPKPRKFEPFVPPDFTKISGIDSSFRPTQKVHLHPPREAMLIEDNWFVADKVAKIGAASEVDFEAVAAALERMLAYEGKFKGINFAACARRELKTLADSLEGIERLGEAIRAILRENVPPANEDGCRLTSFPT